MPYTADDCSDLCWPSGGSPRDVAASDHVKCEAELMDFSDPAKRYAYCACACHHLPGLPGFRSVTSGRHVTREQYVKWSQLPEPVINFVIEARKPGRGWITMTNAGADEVAGRGAYSDWVLSKYATGSSTEYRLVKRTAVITDEVLLITGSDDESVFISGNERLAKLLADHPDLTGEQPGDGTSGA
jgi:hypothetical protein